MTTHTPDVTLCLTVDAERCGLRSPEAVLSRALRSGVVSLVHWRARDIDISVYLRRAHAMAAMCTGSGIPFLLAGRRAMAGAFGGCLLPAADFRTTSPTAGIAGMIMHSPDDLDGLGPETPRPDYVVLAGASSPDGELYDCMAELRRRWPGVPLCPECDSPGTAGQPWMRDMDGIVVCQSVCASPQPERLLRQYRAARMSAR